MKADSVIFKGMRGGLKIHIRPGSDIDNIKREIRDKLKEGRHFFDDTTVNLLFTGQTLTPSEQLELIEIISNEIEIGDVDFGEKFREQDDKVSERPYMFTGIKEGMTRFVEGPVRSGQRIFYEGNIVVIGDVNPGGEVIAGGNIIIIGTLRGLAHAGATGNGNSVIVCLDFKPTQIRIGKLISRPPEGENDMQPIYPEIAYVKDDILVIEPVK
ncbi:MAG TPA: septum site-determining protein MinC [Clostridiales bacterium]|nr:septum site-determining protein MinC [Clostridiales bacterium]